MVKKPTEPAVLGGGWYRTPGGEKVRGRVAAYKASGLDPDKYSRQKAAAAQHSRTRQDEIAARRVDVAQLLRSKVPHRVIAEQLDISMDTLYKDVTAVRDQWRDDQLDAIADEAIEELQSLREDEYRIRMALQRDPSGRSKLHYYDRIMKIQIRRGDLLGLDAPRVTAILTATSKQRDDVIFTVGGGTSEEYVDALILAQGLDPDTVPRLPDGSK
ncbi:MAG: hypothetical protein DRH89_09165 [Candidatus Cloacimonadota bacterium]|nr:MAG: hypothetical protein DRH89_09165 [Candidatus Cloacimonadota bacterium]